MKKLIILAALAATVVSMNAGTAMADSIRGKLGVYANAGFISPADNNAENYDNRTDHGFITGAGLIYGFDDRFAGEIGVSRSTFGSDTGDFAVTNFSVGGQYRFLLQQRQLVPYVGAGVDIIMNSYDENGGAKSDVDTVVGFQLSGGVDYFVKKNFALTAEAKIVAASDATITDNQSGGNAGSFDPSSFSTTVGVRYFFN